MRRRPFLLLEILIAITLVTLFAIPFILNPTMSIVKEMQILERMECERIADLTFAEVKEKLLKNEIPWDGTKKTYKLPPSSLQLKGFAKKEVQRQFVIKIKNEKEGNEGEILRNLSITITLTLPKISLPYEYRLFAKKTPGLYHKPDEKI